MERACRVCRALSRSTLAGWVGACGVALQPLVQALRTHLATHRVLHADETPVAVLAPGAGRTHRAYLWAYRSGPQESAAAVVFDFQMSRAGKHAQQFLEGFSGAQMVDDYAGYKALFASGACIELACLSHRETSWRWWKSRPSTVHSVVRSSPFLDTSTLVELEMPQVRMRLLTLTASEPVLPTSQSHRSTKFAMARSISFVEWMAHGAVR